MKNVSGAGPCGVRALLGHVRLGQVFDSAGSSGRLKLAISCAVMREECDSKPARVLAVDDSPVIRLLVSTALEARGFSVKTVDSGSAALQACEDEHFDVVVLDVEMPGDIDGLAVGRSLRGSGRNSETMIAMHTGVQEEAVRNGFDDYDAFLAKPCDSSRLSACVHDLLRGAASRRRVR